MLQMKFAGVSGWKRPNGQGLAAASRLSRAAVRVESGVKIAPTLARSGRLQPLLARVQLVFWLE